MQPHAQEAAHEEQQRTRFRHFDRSALHIGIERRGNKVFKLLIKDESTCQSPYKDIEGADAEIQPRERKGTEDKIVIGAAALIRIRRGGN